MVKEKSLIFLKCKKTFKLDVIICVQGEFHAILELKEKENFAWPLLVKPTNCKC
jgi:hypothetical protein